MTKQTHALTILRDCFGPGGVWASPDRYRHQCWTRDFALAILPLLLTMGTEGTVLINTHLGNLARHQRVTGQIPILFVDDETAFLRSRIERSIARGKMSFMLDRWLMGELWNLTPGTRDSELMYLLAMLEIVSDSSTFVDMFHLVTRASAGLRAAFEYLHQNLLDDTGLFLLGADWRDTMHEELADKALLSNNSILYHVYALLAQMQESDMGETMALANCVTNGQSASAMRDRLAEGLTQHFFDGLYRDHPDTLHFDPLGASLGVLYGAIPPNRYGSVLAGFDSVDTPLGPTITCKHNPVNDAEATMIERTQGKVVWPFVVGFCVLALIEMGEHGRAHAMYTKIESHSGFWEYYDPTDGTGYGSPEQLWSAVLYLRATHAIENLA